jgi:hypothetical protein
VVECSTYVPNIQGLKPATGAGREKNSNKSMIDPRSLLCHSNAAVKHSTQKLKNKGSNPAMKSTLPHSSTVVEHSIHYPKINGSNLSSSMKKRKWQQI